MNKKDFQNGYLCALSCIVSGHGTDMAVREALQGIGINSVSDLRKSGADPYDIEKLTPTAQEIEDLVARRGVNV